MWDQLASAWNVVGEAAASATESLLEGAGAVADEAGRMAQATKLHAEIGLAQHSIDSIKRTWGYEAFDAMVAGDTEESTTTMSMLMQGKARRGRGMKVTRRWRGRAKRETSGTRYRERE